MFKYGILKFTISHLSRGRAIVLAYHRIIPSNEIDVENHMGGMYLSVEAFKKQLEWLISNMKIVSLSELILKIKNGERWTESLCAITFDDGWKDNYDFAFPILKELNVPATIFLVGKNFLDGDGFTPISWFVIFESIIETSAFPGDFTGNWEIDFVLSSKKKPTEKARDVIRIMRKLPVSDFEELYNKFLRKLINHCSVEKFKIKYSFITIDEVREMSRFGISFGYHSRSHNMLPMVKREQLIAEVQIPHQLSSNSEINHEKIFCYPDGQSSPDIISELKKENYLGAVGLKGGFNSLESDLYNLKRINIHEGSSSSLPLFLSNLLLW